MISELDQIGLETCPTHKNWSKPVKTSKNRKKNGSTSLFITSNYKSNFH